MAKRLLPSYTTLYITPSKQIQLMGQSTNQYLLKTNTISQINTYSSQSTSTTDLARTQSKSKVIYKKVQSPLSAHKKVSSISSNSPGSPIKSFSISNTMYNSVYTESKQQLATQSIQNQPTYFNDSLLGTNLPEAEASSTSSKQTNAYVATTRKNKSDQSESRERFNHLRYFYSDLEIDKAIEKPLIRLNPMAMMYMGVSDDKSHLIRSANYLRNQMPIR